MTRYLSRLSPSSGVGDDDAAEFDVGEVGDQRRRVHHHQHVEFVARGHDLAGAKINLKRRYTECGAGGGADFGGEIGEGCQIVSGQRGGQRKLSAGELHTAAGISGEPDNV